MARNQQQFKNISQQLAANTAPLLVNLSCEDFNDEDLMALGDAIQKNSNISVLLLCHDKLTSSAMVALTGRLANHPSLTQLNIADNSVTDEALDKIADIIPSLSKLSTLNLSGNEVSGKGIAKIILAAKNNVFFNHLNLINCQLSEEDFIEINKALKENFYLMSMDWVGDYDSQHTTQKLLERNSKLLRLYRKVASKLPEIETGHSPKVKKALYEDVLTDVQALMADNYPNAGFLYDKIRLALGGVYAELNEAKQAWCRFDEESAVQKNCKLRDLYPESYYELAEMLFRLGPDDPYFPQQSDDHFRLIMLLLKKIPSDLSYLKRDRMALLAKTFERLKTRDITDDSISFQKLTGCDSVVSYHELYTIAMHVLTQARTTIGSQAITALNQFFMNNADYQVAVANFLLEIKEVQAALHLRFGSNHVALYESLMFYPEQYPNGKVKTITLEQAEQKAKRLLTQSDNVTQNEERCGAELETLWQRVTTANHCSTATYQQLQE